MLNGVDVVELQRINDQVEAVRQVASPVGRGGLVRHHRILVVVFFSVAGCPRIGAAVNADRLSRGPEAELVYGIPNWRSRRIVVTR